MLSLFVKLHETSPGSLRGIRKKVQLILKVHNTNPSNYYNDFGVGKRKIQIQCIMYASDAVFNMRTYNARTSPSLVQ